MSGDFDSSRSPTAKWLTQDRRGDRGRKAEEEGKTTKNKKTKCVKSAMLLFLSPARMSLIVFICQCALTYFLLKR